jgi:hypothetical protein
MFRKLGGMLGMKDDRLVIGLRHQVMLAERRSVHPLLVLLDHRGPRLCPYVWRHSARRGAGSHNKDWNLRC